MNSNNMFHVLPKDAYAQYISGEAHILDVREAESRTLQPKMRQLVSVPLSQLQSKIAAIPTDKPIYVLSAEGKSAANAVAVLRQNGFAATKNIYEGLKGWEQYGLPVEQVAAPQA
jgi:rhodanese-related sulfurtransferase